MAIEMAKLFLSGLSTASDMLSLAIFKGTAMLLVVIFRVIQLPGWAINCVLCLIRESIVTMMETIVDISGKWLVSAVITGSELVTNATTTAVSSLSEVVTVQTELLVNATAEVYQLASETGAGIASTLWENFQEAVDFFIKYAANN
ncbi:hypothetical protein FCM35_KLT17803 [Carex littledalei]|uniref:Uncharacterized protein n=1 Tax=Carex littledalei TaxID=544730 RepID=A0A833RDM1_9POAL|nr:hypothetical protein FCM35_KLT17803 [Carex littledalei]